MFDESGRDVEIPVDSCAFRTDNGIRARGRRAEKERERRLLEEGAGGRINVPYSQGGQKALGLSLIHI